jgi:hypothetical protein
VILQPSCTVAFNPALKSHRDAAIAFMRRNAWGDSPFRFTHDAAFSSVSDQVRAKLLDWYVREDLSMPKRTDRNPVLILDELNSFSASKVLAFAMMGIASEYKPETQGEQA